MPHRLKQRQAKIQAKRKTTPWREFVMEIASSIPLVFYKTSAGISRYPETQRRKQLVTPDRFEQEKGDFEKVGIPYTPDKTFFQHFSTLSDKVSYATLLLSPQAENCGYSDATRFSKNVYLSYIVIDDCENISYSFYLQDHISNTHNSIMVWDTCDTVYMSSAVLHSSKIFYSKYITNSTNIWFCSNMIGCHECLLCDRLTNQSYCIKNKKMSKEAYMQQKQNILQKKEAFPTWFSSLTSTSSNYGSEKVQGQFCIYSKNLSQAAYCYRVVNGRNALFAGDEAGKTNIYDVFGSDQTGNGNMYGCSNMGTSDHAYCSDCCQVTQGYYCFFCIQCSYCLGCIGLTNKSYCIFNIQYTKEERYDKVDEIFTQMEQDGEFGKFFPGSMNPFYFNDTAAYLIDDSFTKQEVEAAGYLRRDEQIKVDIPEGVDVISVDDLDQYEGRIVGTQEIASSTDTPPGATRHITPSILKKVIKDKSGNVYRIVKMEYDFLMKHALPLPRKHWLERIKEHVSINLDRK